MSALNKLAEPLAIGKVVLPNRIFMAPMSGVTDNPFRKRGIAHGAGLTVSEMIASNVLAANSAESLRRMRRNAGAHVHSVQLAGRDPSWMGDAARRAEASGADIIDINMGCPAKKVIGGYSGSALMREPARALKIISSVVAAVDIPVTLKMRLGWDENCINAPLIAARAELAGVSMLTVHGRTRSQFYKGHADWAAIAAVKQAVSIPVVANGDVDTAAHAAAILIASGADAIMIGRGHYGRPWLAGTIASQAGYSAGNPSPANASEMAAYVVSHYEDMLSFYGKEKGYRHARKHIGWYLDRFAAATEPGQRLLLLRDADPDSVIRNLQHIRWAVCGTVSEEIAA